MPRSPLNRSLIVTQDFMANAVSYPGTHGHPGVDLRAPLGEDYFACVPGVLGIRTDRDALGRLIGYGQAAFVDWGQANNTFIRFLYGHGRNRRRRLDHKHVEEGQYIAESGNTGRTTGAHLHFEMRRYHRPGSGPGRYYDKSVKLTYDLLDPLKEFFDAWKIPYTLA